MTIRPLPTPRQAAMACALAGGAAVLGACLPAAATLARAPPLALPFVIGVCIGGPMLAVWELPISLAVLREWRRMSASPAESTEALEPWALDELVRELDDPAET